MNPNKALWEKGDFTWPSAACATAAKRSSTAQNHPRYEILDLGCGDGMTALPEASVAPMFWASISPQISSRQPPGG
jgi:cyclopropane fatty-acyl-phospholipid synthase-like methyltransferase